MASSSNNNQKRVQGTALRALNVLKILKGHSIDGLSNKAISDALEESPSQIALSLNSLEHVGFVHQLENKNYAHSVEFIAIAKAHDNHVAKTLGRIDEMELRIKARTNQ